MKKLPLKHKFFLLLAAVLLLVWSYMASGHSSPSKQTETQTVLTTNAVLTTNTVLTTAEPVTEPTTFEETTTAAPTTETATQTVTETQTQTVTENAAVTTAAPATQAPVQTAEAPQEKNLCTLSVGCATIFDNLDSFDANKMSLLPPDGIIFAPKTVEFNDGDTVFDVLKREMIANGIHLEFSQVPMYDSVYIEGINNIYEFDCGELSGWMYKVNGKYPGYGCNMYKLKSGDTIEWIYTCDLGRDIGGDSYDH